MALLSPQVLTALTGNVVTTSAVAASDTIAPNAAYQLVLVVINGNASPDTVTISTTGYTDPWGTAKTTVSKSVTNGTTQYFWLPRANQIADGTTGLITVTHSVTSTVTCSLIAIPVNF